MTPAHFNFLRNQSHCSFQRDGSNVLSNLRVVFTVTPSSLCVLRSTGQVYPITVACCVDPSTSTEGESIRTASSQGPTVVFGETASPDVVVSRRESAATGENLRVSGQSGRELYVSQATTDR